MIQLAQQVCLKMIEAILQLKQESENKDAMDESITPAAVEKKQKAFKKRIEEVADASIANVENPRNLYAIAQTLHSRLEYGLAIKVGARCQERIDILIQQNDERADLTQKIAGIPPTILFPPCLTSCNNRPQSATNRIAKRFSEGRNRKAIAQTARAAGRV